MMRHEPAEAIRESFGGCGNLKTALREGCNAENPNDFKERWTKGPARFISYSCLLGYA
jgi:hypothetical protein